MFAYGADDFFVIVGSYFFVSRSCGLIIGVVGSWPTIALLEQATGSSGEPKVSSTKLVS